MQNSPFSLALLQSSCRRPMLGPGRRSHQRLVDHENCQQAGQGGSHPALISKTYACAAILL